MSKLSRAQHAYLFPVKNQPKTWTTGTTVELVTYARLRDSGATRTALVCGRVFPEFCDEDELTWFAALFEGRLCYLCTDKRNIVRTTDTNGKWHPDVWFIVFVTSSSQ